MQAFCIERGGGEGNSSLEGSLSPPALVAGQAQGGSGPWEDRDSHSAWQVDTDEGWNWRPFFSCCPSFLLA